MSPDFEFNDWRAEWQAQVEAGTGSPGDVRRSALKQQRRLRASHVLELLSGVLFLVFSAIFAWRVRSKESLLWAGFVWLTTIIASAFSLRNWSILWKHDLKSVAEFSELYEKRCQAKLRAARFGHGFVIVQACISGSWLIWDYTHRVVSAARFGTAALVLVFLSVGFWMMFSRYRRSAFRELSRLGATRNNA